MPRFVPMFLFWYPTEYLPKGSTWAPAQMLQVHWVVWVLSLAMVPLDRWQRTTQYLSNSVHCLGISMRPPWPTVQLSATKSCYRKPCLVTEDDQLLSIGALWILESFHFWNRFPHHPSNVAKFHSLSLHSLPLPYLPFSSRPNPPTSFQTLPQFACKI